jgi:hypothetical protein
MDKQSKRIVSPGNVCVNYVFLWSMDNHAKCFLKIFFHAH